MSTFEDLVHVINTNNDPFQLMHQMPVIKAGLMDLQNRLESLEKKVAALETANRPRLNLGEG